MAFHFKEDWDKCKERYDAFWEGEIVDRCCMAVAAPRSMPLNVNAVGREPKDLDEQWKSFEYQRDQLLSRYAKTFYGGEAFPLNCCYVGPGVAACFVGCDYVLAKETVWFDRNPPIREWAGRPGLKLIEASELWQQVLKFTADFAEKAEGSYFVGLTDLGGNYDIAASLRGTEKLLYDMTDNPDEVKILINEIDSVWFECYKRLQYLINLHMEGSSAWMGLWCRQRWYPLQCDFSAMLSPAMFEEFVKPSLAREAEFLDKSIYHWDGIGQLPHIDHLLDIDSLTGIQWTPGAGKPGVDDEVWFPIYKKIQAKGKKLVLLGAKPEKIEKLLENVSPRGLFISIFCNGEEEAKEVLNKAGKWSNRK